MRRQAIAATLLSLLFAAAGRAQVVFEPVVSQYRTTSGESIYYGGRDLRAVAAAAQRLAEPPRTGSDRPRGRFGFDLARRGVINEPPLYTLTDGLPYRNAAIYGYTSVDARNDAYANVPRFFRMADLLATAEPAADGVGAVVPAQAAGTIDVRPVRKAAASAGPPPAPRPVLILPKKRFERPAAPAQVVAFGR